MDGLYKRENAALSIGEKIKLLRKAVGLTQAELAEIMWSSAGKISRVENGEEEYNQEELKALKEHFGFAEMPLTELECAAFKERLHMWRDLIRDGRLDEARELHIKISPIINFEACEPDLSILFRLYEVLLLLYEKNLFSAEDKLNYLSSVMDKMSNEHIYHYNHMMGSFSSMCKDSKNALKYYLQAYELTKSLANISPEDKEKLCYNIASCYQNLDLPNSAILFLYEVYKADTKKRITAASLSMDITLARSYIKIGEFEKAEQILNQCLVWAKGIEDSYNEAVTLFYLALLYRYSEDWGKSIEYFTKTLDIFDTSSDFHPWAFYYQIRCLIASRKFLKAEEMLNEAKSYYGTDDEYSILFESLNHLLILSKRLTMKNNESVEYIETVAIPHLLKIHVSFEAISYYEVLEKHYAKTKKLFKSLQMSKEIRGIYERMFTGKKGGST